MRIVDLFVITFPFVLGIVFCVYMGVKDRQEEKRIKELDLEPNPYIYRGKYTGFEPNPAWVEWVKRQFEKNGKSAFYADMESILYIKDEEYNVQVNPAIRVALNNFQQKKGEKK